MKSDDIELSKWYYCCKMMETVATLTTFYYYHFKSMLQWNPTITKCHGTKKNVCYIRVFVIVKTQL